MRSFSFMKHLNEKAFENNTHLIFYGQWNNQEKIIILVLNKRNFCWKRGINTCSYRLANVFLHTTENVLMWEPFRINYWTFHLKGLWANDIRVWDFSVETTHALKFHANLGLQRGLNTPQNCVPCSCPGRGRSCGPCWSCGAQWAPGSVWSSAGGHCKAQASAAYRNGLTALILYPL